MMIGPMKKKVITSAVVTALVLIVIFSVVSVIYVSQSNKTIAELKERGEVVQRYVFTKDMTIGDVVTADDIKYVDVKGESAPYDSYIHEEEIVNGKTQVTMDEKYSIIGKRLKVNAAEKTIVAESLFYAEDKEPEVDTRLQEFNMITLPSDLNVGDYIDVRIRFATGEDYSVLVGKKVYSFGSLEAETNTVFLRLNEEEIVRMGSAIIESYIRGGVNLYANKYVDPDAQLHTYDRVDYVAKYQDALYVTEESVNESGEVVEDKTMRSISEIATIIGLNKEETENIKVAIDTKDEDTLAYYKDKLVVGDKSIEKTYPVKVEIATLIQNNPNILSEIKAKYNVEKLEQERIHFLNTDLTKIDEMTGELKDHEEHINSITENLEAEITTQRTERQEYLLQLLAGQTTTTND